MSNQCFWISILDYLNRNGQPQLTLKELRTQAGLDASTEHTMFDSNFESFRDAANRIVARYNLTITILPINGNGDVLYNGNLGDRFGNGANRIEIGQYGIAHFQLIVGNIAEGEKNNFQPFVLVKTRLVELKSLSEEKQMIYKKYNENLSFLKIIKFQLDEDKAQYSKLTDEKFTIKDSKDLEHLYNKNDTDVDTVRRLLEFYKTVYE
jgi:hypothetical protein